MRPEDNTNAASINRAAIASLVAGLLTLLALCVAIVPIPFTGYICFPAAGLLGALAVVSGLRSRHQIRLSGEKGIALAAIGIAMGALAVAAELCIAVLAIILSSRLAEAVRLLTH